MAEYKEGDIILCTVENIVGTTVFVITEDNVKGSIVLSEIAPGRIRNLREYVVPKKTIVCKILKIADGHLFLSLRRVKKEERENIIDQNKKDKTWQFIIKKIAGEKEEEITRKIKLSESLNEFFEKARNNPKEFERYFNQKEIEELTKIVKEKKEKEKEIKKDFSISSWQPDGMVRIKKILSPYENIFYLGGSKFQIKIKSADIKKADHEIQEIIGIIEKQAKKEKCEFRLKK